MTDVYVAELVVESNDSVPSDTVLLALKLITDLRVTDSNGVSNIVTLMDSGLVAGTMPLHLKKKQNKTFVFLFRTELMFSTVHIKLIHIIIIKILMIYHHHC